MIAKGKLRNPLDISCRLMQHSCDFLFSNICRYIFKVQILDIFYAIHCRGIHREGS
jgi:hypothetical protein